MKVIFKKDLAKVGRKNQVKDVSDGYALNFLIPNGFAIVATPQAEKELAKQKLSEDAEKNVQDALLHKSLETIATTRLKIIRKANDKGHLFSGIHPNEIAEELMKNLHLSVPVNLINIEHPLKETGEHKVVIGSGKKAAALIVEIVGEQ